MPPERDMYKTIKVKASCIIKYVKDVIQCLLRNATRVVVVFCWKFLPHRFSKFWLFKLIFYVILTVLLPEFNKISETFIKIQGLVFVSLVFILLIVLQIFFFKFFTNFLYFILIKKNRWNDSIIMIFPFIFKLHIFHFFLRISFNEI